MATINLSWTATGSPEGHYIFAGKVSGVYTERSSAIAMPTTSGSITVPTTGAWYVAVAGYVTVDGVHVLSPYSTPVLMTAGGLSATILLRTR